MKILVVAVSSTTEMTGVSRHATNVVRCLLSHSDVSRLNLIVAPWQHQAFQDAISRADLRLTIHSAPIAPGTLRRNLWYYTSLPAIAAQLEADVVHLSYPNPLRPGAFHCPTIVSLHDLYPFDIPKNFGFGKVYFNRLMLKQSLRAADAIACISNTTRQQLGVWTSQDVMAKSTVVYNCIESPPPASEHSALPSWSGNPFFLCVAAHLRNKNIVFALRVFKKLLVRGEISPSTNFVVVGILATETPQILRFVRKARIAERVVFLHGITDAEMQWCYQHCEALLAPSIVEGFGYPVAEGLMAGCRIVCSDIPAFRELGGSDCRYVPLGLGAEEAFAEAIRAELEKGRNPPFFLPQCSVPVIAGQYMDLYRRTILQHDSRRSVSPGGAHSRCG